MGAESKDPGMASSGMQIQEILTRKRLSRSLCRQPCRTPNGVKGMNA